MNKHHSLNQIFARRWVVPILAQLADTNGCKFVTLTSKLNGSRSSLKASLEVLDSLGLVRPNTGTGHPMRPEYLLTNCGKLVSRPAAALVQTLEQLNEIELGLKKWSMPTLHAVSMGADRFGTIAHFLRSATDRAVSLALMDLQGVSMIHRNLIDGHPPHSSYKLAGKAKQLSPILTDIHQAIFE